MFSALDSRLGGPSSSLGRETVLCFWEKTLYSHGASFHQVV